MRNTGETTRQMQEAHRDAVYIWVAGSPREYARDLARHLGRADLEIVSPEWLDRSRGWRGRILSAVVLDHECRLTSIQWKIYNEVTQRRLTV